MLISIITPSLNQASFIEATMRSVFEQDHPDVEYVVMDGGSSDGSVETIRRHAWRLGHWESAPDGGQADAINGGLRAVHGDVIGYLNSDDLYLPGALSAVARAFHGDSQMRWLAGGCLFFGSGAPTALVPATPSADVVDWLVANRIAQPAVFLRRELFASYGAFDTKLRYCFDWEYWLRLLVAGERCRTLALPLAAFRLHVDSKTVREAGPFEAEALRVRERYARGLNLRDRQRLQREIVFEQAILEAEAAGARRQWRSARRLWTRALRSSPALALRWRVVRHYARALVDPVWSRWPRP